MMYDFFGEVLVKVFAHFQNRIVYFLILSFKSSFYILNTIFYQMICLQNICFAKICFANISDKTYLYLCLSFHFLNGLPFLYVFFSFMHVIIPQLLNLFAFNSATSSSHHSSLLLHRKPNATGSASKIEANQ